MAKVIEFPNSSPTSPVKMTTDVSRRYVSTEPERYNFFHWCSRALTEIAGFFLGFVRAVALTLLLWFRPILFVVVRPLSGLLLIAFIVCLFTHPADQRLTFGFGLLSLGAYLIMHLYDGFLVFLARGNVVNILN
ncbi:hypothetical protein RO575_22780 [Methylomonas sp. MO1]|uniref:hypothetical protein n=1 Tax=Methylomonas sp. MO1 TaxID=3073619 RepID=UPI0028A403F8|nr:hypothetical protein [Methylomonas sp. MO1]MDT4292399.1 hypothetical protein [Methylomonas sp. MO1]